MAVIESLSLRHHSVGAEALSQSHWTTGTVTLGSSGAQVEHNKASENCFIAAIASGDAVLM